MAHERGDFFLPLADEFAGGSPRTVIRQKDFARHFGLTLHAAQDLVQRFRSLVSRDDQDMRDLAAYYHYLPREGNAISATVAQETPIIVSNGAPMRNIGACASCHAQLSGKAAIPLLDGEPESYIRAQLQAFAAGNRHNDINEQMRNVTRHMTSEEIDAAARYYANR